MSDLLVGVLAHHVDTVNRLTAERDAARRDLCVQQEAVHDDLRAILLALGLGDHARPYSSHMVVAREVLPAIERLRPTP